jgi:glycine/D-amino acid oxidase-like deaminating enzyme
MPDPKKALQLLEKAKKIYPGAKEFEIVGIQVGVRIAPKIGYWPILQRVDSKTWVFTGLGSRGLMYHALLAKRLSNCFLDESSSIIEP